MRRRRVRLDLILTAGLVLLVGALAVLQYRWLGSVSDAERARLRQSLDQRAADLARDVDREITRLYVAFQTAGLQLVKGDLEGFASQVDAWSRSSEPAALLVEHIFRVTPDDHVELYHPADRIFTPIGARPFDPELTISIPLPAVKALEPAGLKDVLSFRLPADSLVLRLDRHALTERFLPALVDRYFPASAADFRLAIVDARHPSTTIFSRGVATGTALDAARADLTVDLLTIRPDLVDTMFAARGRTFVFGDGHQERAGVQREVRAQIVVQQRSARGGPGSVAAVRTVGLSPWRLLVQHVSGSLETVVAQARRRNLALSFGILALLGISVSLLVVNAQRSRRLATQQMDFVATVSHELRTPLAVIRSAAQNLAAGVVDDPAHSRRYGALIDAEGRRLTEMVEEVLAFAGLSGQRRAFVRKPVDLVALASAVAADRDAWVDTPVGAIAVRADGAVPQVTGDEEALGRAIRNLVGNAVKYGAGPVDVCIRPVEAKDGRVVQLAVRDQGPGIDPADLPHIFEPFYRGRNAIDQQRRGNGLGLALVKGIAESHGGSISVESAPGQGATFTLALPAAPTPANERERVSHANGAGRTGPRE